MMRRGNLRREHPLEHARGDLRIAMPLGLGKPNVLFNALYARVAADRAAAHDIVYSLVAGSAESKKRDLEKRFLEPFLARHFWRGPLSGSRLCRRRNTQTIDCRKTCGCTNSICNLGRCSAWRSRSAITSAMNYTHVARDLVVGAGINLILQLIAVRTQRWRARALQPCIQSRCHLGSARSHCRRPVAREAVGGGRDPCGSAVRRQRCRS